VETSVYKQTRLLAATTRKSREAAELASQREQAAEEVIVGRLAGLHLEHFVGESLWLNMSIQCCVYRPHFARSAKHERLPRPSLHHGSLFGLRRRSKSAGRSV
jgi:hypothetical protein